MPVPRWARGPFELLVQAELHFRGATEQDKRLALIGFDNSIEISIITYLHLHREQRLGREIEREIIRDAERGFHSLLDFYYANCCGSGQPQDCSKSDLIHFHRVRNEQYHGGTLTVPSADDVTGARLAAHWVFASLFDVEALEDEVQSRIELIRPPLPQRNDIYDHLIDTTFEPVQVAGLAFRCSEILFAVDESAYRELGMELEAEGHEEGDPLRLVGVDVP